MASQFLSVGYVPWLDGETFNALIGRSMLIGGTFFNSGPPNQVLGGVLPGSGELVVTPGSGMNVALAAGNCVVASSAGSTQGGYLVSLMANGTLPVAAADSSNPRIDLICATVVDNGDNTSYAGFQIITGTPAPSPAAPALPGNSEPLATVRVPANATSIAAGNITSQVNWTAAAGGIIPVSSLSAAPSGYEGNYIHDRSTGRLVHNGKAGPAQPKLLPFQPVVRILTASQNITVASESNILQTNVTTDGETDLEITFTWPGIYSNAGSTFRITFRLYIDNVQVDAAYCDNPFGDGNNRSPGSKTYATTSAFNNTPGAGTHNIRFAGQAVTANGAIFAASYASPQLIVKPMIR